MAKLTPKLSLYGEVLRVLEQAQADYVIRLISPSAWAVWQKLKRAAREPK